MTKIKPLAMNPNKWFKKLSIKTKLIFAFVVFTVFPLTIISSYSIYIHNKDLENIAIDCLNQDVVTTSGKLEKFLFDTENDIRYLSRMQPLSEFVNALNSGTDPTGSNHIKKVLLDFENFIDHHHSYHSISFIHLMEEKPVFVTVNRFSDQTTYESIMDSGDVAFYSNLVKNIKQDGVAFVTSEVERGNQSIRVINYVQPLKGSGDQLIGILMTAIYADEFLKILNEYNMMGEALLLNQQGTYLFESNRESTWEKFVNSKNLLNQADRTLYDDYPSNIASQIISGAPGAITKGTDNILSFAPIVFNPDATNYIFCRSVPKEIIFASILKFKGIFITFTGGSLVIAILLGFVAARTFTLPIKQLIRGAEIIAGGDYDYPIKVKTNDELQTLADGFQFMAHSLKDRETELANHRHHLEKMVEKRTYQLSGEKTKLQAIIDNVPSAFILRNEDFQIQIASAAFQTISGHDTSDLEGQDLREIEWIKKFLSLPDTKQALSLDHIQTDLRVVSVDNENKFIEHTSVPIKKNGELESILEILTDVTKRRKMEQQLIESEKLVTVGAMAAVIAHEIRNSLSSIKIMLQLQTESASTNDKNAESMRTVIESVDRMEQLVYDLLKFSRPAPLTLVNTNLNAVVSVSIDFAYLQIDKKDIRIKQSLDIALPDVTIDKEALKEVLTNLILNAHQAIEQSGTITISTGIEVLDETIEDLSYFYNLKNISASLENMYEGLRSNKTTLNKGLKVAKVTITDTGSGIDKENLPRIFEPFFSTKVSGSGLGLAMVKRTIAEHGGIINVASKKGEGTKFTILLPLKDP